MVYNIFDKKKNSAWAVRNEIISNKELAKELHKPIIRKIKKRKVTHLIDNNWNADLTDMQLISKFNKGFRLLLCVIDIYSKYAGVIPLKDKKGITITNAFQKILDESKRKPNIFQTNDIEMYSTHNEWKSFVAERFIWTLKNKIYKYMASI